MRHNVRIGEPWKAKLLKKTGKCEFTYIVGEWCGRLLWLGRHQKPSAPNFDDFRGFQFLRILLPQSYSSDCLSVADTCQPPLPKPPRAEKKVPPCLPPQMTRHAMCHVYISPRVGLH